MIELGADNSIRGRSVLELIGNTPLLSLKRLAEPVAPARVFAKAEWYNPGGSIKDRAAMNMILDGEARNLLTPDKIIIDATSGNTGIAYAMIAAERGYRVTLALPANASRERKQSLQAYGATLVLTDPTEGTDGAQRYVKKMVAENRDKYFYPDQYNNPANWQAHYNGTANEIWRQTAGKITHFVAGLGTSGTFVGVTRRLKELNPKIRCISMQPDAPLHGMEGLKHMPTALRPGIYDDTLADEQIEISTEDAHSMVLALARKEGLLVGVSAGGNLAAAMKVAGQANQKVAEPVVVTVFCDSAAKYLSEEFWSENADSGSELAMTSIILPNDVYEQIEREGIAAYPSECCGILIGRDADGERRVEKLVPMQNTFDAAERYHRFTIDPLALAKADDDASKDGRAVLGFYHSHPDHPARPSEYDRTHVPPWSFYSHIIVAIEKGAACAMTCWTMNEETEQFDERKIERR